MGALLFVDDPEYFDRDGLYAAAAVITRTTRSGMPEFWPRGDRGGEACLAGGCDSLP